MVGRTQETDLNARLTNASLHFVQDFVTVVSRLIRFKVPILF